MCDEISFENAFRNQLLKTYVRTTTRAIAINIIFTKHAILWLEQTRLSFYNNQLLFLFTEIERDSLPICATDNFRSTLYF